MWRALDDRLERVEPQPWGALVTDARFPLIWDVNYARVETDDASLRLSDIDGPLEPALERVQAAHHHVVLFHPEELTEVIAQASRRGARLTWDVVMLLDTPASPTPRSQAVVEEVAGPDDRFFATVRRTLGEFGVTDDAVARQLLRIEREVMLPAGKRWFRVGAPGDEAALGSLIVLDGVGLVDHIVTMPPARGRGYAEAVVRRIVDQARAAGTDILVLLAEPEGPARRIYERIGFRSLTTIASTVERRQLVKARSSSSRHVGSPNSAKHT
jgi:GNAT superfamily N-acetyltransferase